MKTISIHTIMMIFPLFLISCADSFDYEVKGKEYYVNANSLNVREKAKPHSRILGKLKKGDVVVANFQVREWINFDYKNTTSYVSSKYLIAFEVIEMENAFDPGMNPEAHSFKTFVDEYGDWASWKFWVTLLVLSFVSIILLVTGVTIPTIERIVHAGYREYGHYYPYFTALLGFLFSLVFVFGKESVLKAIFVDPFWPIPEDGAGFVAWYLWLLAAAAIIAALAGWIYFIINFMGKGIIYMLFYMFSGTVTFINFVFIGIAGIVVFVILLVGAIGIYFIYALSHDITHGGDYPEYESNKNFQPEKKPNPENDQYVHQQREKKWWEEYHKNNP